MMLAVPGPSAVNTPEALIEAEPEPLITDQVPPKSASVKAGVKAFTQTVFAPPAMAAMEGNGFTVTETVFDVIGSVELLAS